MHIKNSTSDCKQNSLIMFGYPDHCRIRLVYQLKTYRLFSIILFTQVTLVSNKSFVLTKVKK